MDDNENNDSANDLSEYHEIMREYRENGISEELLERYAANVQRSYKRYKDVLRRLIEQESMYETHKPDKDDGGPRTDDDNSQ